MHQKSNHPPLNRFHSFMAHFFQWQPRAPLSNLVQRIYVVRITNPDLELLVLRLLQGKRLSGRRPARGTFPKENELNVFHSEFSLAVAVFCMGPFSQHSTRGTTDMRLILLLLSDLAG